MDAEPRALPKRASAEAFTHWMRSIPHCRSRSEIGGAAHTLAHLGDLAQVGHRNVGIPYTEPLHGRAPSLGVGAKRRARGRMPCLAGSRVARSAAAKKKRDSDSAMASRPKSAREKRRRERDYDTWPALVTVTPATLPEAPAAPASAQQRQERERFEGRSRDKEEVLLLSDEVYEDADCEPLTKVARRNCKETAEERLADDSPLEKMMMRFEQSPGEQEDSVKGPWHASEDQRLVAVVNTMGAKQWTRIADKMQSFGHRRKGKQCRERWHNHLSPTISKRDFSAAEDELIVLMHRKIGNKWADIAKILPGRTDNSVKNRWNGTLRRTAEQKIDSQLAKESGAALPVALADVSSPDLRGFDDSTSLSAILPLSLDGFSQREEQVVSPVALSVGDLPSNVSESSFVLGLLKYVQPEASTPPSVTRTVNVQDPCSTPPSSAEYPRVVYRRRTALERKLLFGRDEPTPASTLFDSALAPSTPPTPTNAEDRLLCAAAATPFKFSIQDAKIVAPDATGIRDSAGVGHAAMMPFELWGSRKPGQQRVFEKINAVCRGAPPSVRRTVPPLSSARMPKNTRSITIRVNEESLQATA